MKVYAAQRDVDVIARAAGCDGELGSEGIIGGEGGVHAFGFEWWWKRKR